MGIARPQLPFGFRDLEPAMSRETLWYHYSRQELGCFEPATGLVRGTGLDALDLEELVLESAQVPACRLLFQYAAGLWNHNAFWQSMKPDGGGAPTGLIAQHIEAEFGSYGTFVDEFAGAAADLYGNGWLWLIWDAGVIRIVTTVNSDTPIAARKTVLLAVDLWEHAYYLDYQNRRSAYVAAYLERLVNWDFANRNLHPPVGAARDGS